MNLDPGSLIYFKNFHYKNGKTPEPKFFIVLKKLSDGNNLIATLPTSKDFVPKVEGIALKHGCIDSYELCFNCYHFEASRVITDSNFVFSLPTFIYGKQLEDYDNQYLIKNHPNPSDYEHKGILLENEFANILACLKNSNNVNRKFKRALNS